MKAYGALLRRIPRGEHCHLEDHGPFSCHILPPWTRFLPTRGPPDGAGNPVLTLYAPPHGDGGTGVSNQSCRARSVSLADAAEVSSQGANIPFTVNNGQNGHNFCLDT